MARQTGPSFEIAAADKILEELQRAMDLAPGKAQRAGLRALKQSIRSGKSAASTEIRGTLNLKKPVVDKRIIARIRSRADLQAQVKVVDRKIQLVEFLSKAERARIYRSQRIKRASSSRRAEGVSIKVYKTKGRQVFPGTFLEIGRNSRKWHVLKRALGVGRYPIYIQYGPNMIDDFLKSFPKFAARADEVLERNVVEQLRYIFGEFNG